MRIISYEDIYGDDESFDNESSKNIEELNALIMSGIKKINENIKVLDKMSEDLDAFYPFGTEFSIKLLHKNLMTCKEVLIGEYDNIIDDLMLTKKGITREELYENLQQIRKETITNLKKESDL